jgi:hypothetical protein
MFLDFNSFFDFETGKNILYDLQYLMQNENPDVIVPEVNKGDYNFFEYPLEENPDEQNISYIMIWFSESAKTARQTLTGLNECRR